MNIENGMINGTIKVFEKEINGGMRYAIKRHPQFENYGIRLT